MFSKSLTPGETQPSNPSEGKAASASLAGDTLNRRPMKDGGEWQSVGIVGGRKNTFEEDTRNLRSSILKCLRWYPKVFAKARTPSSGFTRGLLQPTADRG